MRSKTHISDSPVRTPSETCVQKIRAGSPVRLFGHHLKRVFNIPAGWRCQVDRCRLLLKRKETVLPFFKFYFFIIYFLNIVIFFLLSIIST